MAHGAWRREIVGYIITVMRAYTLAESQGHRSAVMRRGRGWYVTHICGRGRPNRVRRGFYARDE